MRYEYENQNISSPATLCQAIAVSGIYDGTFCLVGSSVCIDTFMGNVGQVEAALAMATDGTFFANKATRIREAQGVTGLLASQGTMFFKPSDSSMSGPAELSQDSAILLRTLREAIIAEEIPLPEFVSTTDGRASLLHTVEDADAVYQAVVDRLIYLAGDAMNADNSYGEVAFIQQLLDAENQSALDALIDTRV